MDERGQGALVEARNLTKRFALRDGRSLSAVEQVSFSIARGRTLGLVGESGCGKTTLGRTLLQLYRPTSGEAWFDGRRLDTLSREQLRRLRPRMQPIFQDPYAALSPRMPVGGLIGEAVREHALVPKAQLRAYLCEVLAQCGLEADDLERYPHELSGGQRQRVCIARALALRPEFIVADEPVSALDASIQAQILNLLMELKQRHGLTYLFISHDLSVVEHVSDEVGVMYLGRLVELGPVEAVYGRALHPYTRALLAALPLPDPDLRGPGGGLSGEMPSPSDPPAGCAFHTRCPWAQERCRVERPELRAWVGGHRAACHRVEELS